FLYIGLHSGCALLFLLNTRQSLGLLSDYKTCGDLECESSINRVRAIRNYKNPDCRFLNFRSGDVIFVYHKLSGKRDDLWAGTIGKRFGYFPKDAVEVEETYATKEVQVPTKEHDFFCLDGNGAFIESDSSHWDSEEHQEETARDETESPEASGSGRGSVTKFKNSEGIAKGQENGPAVPHTTDRSEEPKTVERGGSHWLGSGITGWLGIGGQESRKIALDLKDNDLDGNKLETVAEAKKSGWLGGQLSNIFGLSQETPSEVGGPDAPEKQGVKVTLQDRGQSPATSNKRVIAETETTKEEDAQSKSWLSFGVGDLLSYGQKNSDKEGERNSEQSSQMSELKAEMKESNAVPEVVITKDEEHKKEENTGEESLAKFSDEDKEHALSKEEPIISGAINISGLNQNSQEEKNRLKEEEPPAVQLDVESVMEHDVISSYSEDITENVSDLQGDSEAKVRIEETSASENTENMVDEARTTSVPEDTEGQKLQADEARTTSVPEDNDSQKLQVDEAHITKDGRFKEEVTSSSGIGAVSFRMLSWVYMLEDILQCVKCFRKAVSSLPEDMRPGPDLYGLPWEAVILTAFLGGMTVLMFFCRSCRSVKSRLYVGKERKLGEKVAELLEEKCKVLETLSECKSQYEKLETTLKHGGLSEQATEKENLQVMSKKLEQSNAELKDEIERLKQDLDSQKATRSQQGELLAGMQLSLKSLEEEARDVKSQMEQAQTTLKVYDINSERLKKSIQTALEENSHLHESESQLAQEAEGWEERLSELAEELKMCESSRRDMQADSSNKEEQIKTLTDCLLKMKDWDSELEEDANEEEEEGTSTTENGDLDMHQKQKVQKLIYAARMNADLKSMEEEKTRVFARLADEVKTKEDLRDRIGKLQTEKSSLQVESAKYTDETQKLQQKLQIMTEMYQENELKLHRKLTVEEKERLQKEQKLTKADEKISLAAEELNTYRQRTKDLEEELERTYQAYKNQISSHEKKAHDNWLAARAADRDLGDIKRENSHLRQKLTDAQFRLELVEKDPYALDVPGRPLFRGERSPFGPSPLGRPSSETRAFLSPPTLLDGPARLSPQFPGGPGGRASRGPPVLSEGLDCDRILENHGSHSDSGSLSPTWERDRRVQVPPPESFFPILELFFFSIIDNTELGFKSKRCFFHFFSIIDNTELGFKRYPYPDPNVPYRRPPPMPTLPPRLPGPAEPHGYNPQPADRPGLRMRGPPRDHFPRRPPFGPPELFHPRVAGAPPMGLRGPLPPPPPPGMFPRFAPPPPPPPHHLGYPPPRPPSDGSPRPCPAGGE
uniref:MIA SH3 domain ER export factor 2 n=1 Tax=Lepisosteus oculatus TaxID=7918 RepID=W5MS79_LEPOC